MHLERYDYLTNQSFLDYEFISEGPKGKVRKIISYSLRNTNGTSYFNLFLGDKDENDREVDFYVVTNNGDCNKVLATVASTVFEVTRLFPDMAVYAIGSTPARTRLYQMGIFAYWNEIDTYLTVYGSRNNQWEPFQKNINYEAFLVKRKQIVNL